MNTTPVTKIRRALMPKKLTDSAAGRFIIVGASATVIDFGLLILIDTVSDMPVLWANVIATSVAFCFSFFANKNYTFRNSGGNIVREMVLFTLFTLFGLWVLQSLVIHFVLPVAQDLTEWREAALIVAKLVATVVSTIWNYFAYSRVVFRERR